MFLAHPYIFIFLIQIIIYHSVQAHENIHDFSNIVVVLMVKNEVTTIEKTLAPFVEGGISKFLFYDTGSDDGTQIIAQHYFEQCEVQYKIIEEPFINFGESRNKALRYAEMNFPEAKFMLMLDAEWYMDNVSDLVDFCNEEQNEKVELYLIRLISGADEFYVPRLIKTHKNICFEGKIHEAPIVSSFKKIKPSIYFKYQPNRYGIEKSMNRHKRDLIILTEEYEQNPICPRTTFYLAQTYDSLTHFEKAFEFYTKRTKLNGWDEENFMAWYRRGKMATILYHQTKDEDWLARAIQSYEHAWEMIPSRIEPAVALAELYIQENNMHFAYLLLKEIFEYPYPKKNILFTERDKYDFKRYELLSICAWYVGDYELGKKSALKALHYNQELSYLHRNLALYIMKLEV